MTDAPLDYFLHSAGPASAPTRLLDWSFAGICLGVCLIIAVLLVAALTRRRRSDQRGDIGREGDGVSWIYWGTGISAVVLFGMSLYALVALNAVARPPVAPAVTIRVTGYDWWWKADYANDNGRPVFTTANEIHIPTGVPVRIQLESADVIHAFWVPALAGKTEMIPGVSNGQWLQADKPGIYRGQCTQFCGVQHAHMAFEIVAQNPADYQAWLAAQTRPATASVDPAAMAGAQVFAGHCAACHTVRGAGADGDHAPDLTHLMSRRQIAAGTLDNTPQNLMLWVAHAQSVKPGAAMPDTTLSPADADALNAYLTELK